MVDGYGRVDPHNATGEYIHHPHVIGYIDHRHGTLLRYRQVEVERRRTRTAGGRHGGAGACH